ncbi:MAG: glycosyltransferase family 9 protein [Rhodoferax sp.]|uniref:glycosyltransferase family 9 protein n=1 Tax=Rhodoferax sp. TaxID=50421 RepID=UPI001810C0A3|nr:glycosyltransferase family 9 protein [Rhodoferax sp.]NMM12313.1 glycosyltransferase family 9 protein [Rhodoferax sp.]NMM20272.1 glycosyltransferase family 9 protein [Rhodoferax sp.]
MKIQTQRWIDRWLGQLLCGVVSMWVRLISLGRPAAHLSREPRHILVILLSEMGSVVLAGPMFATLRQRYPSATLHVLQLKKNQEVATLLGLAQPEHLHALDDSAGLGLLGDIWRVSMALRRLPLDAVIDCELFSRISSLMSYMSGAPLRVGFTPHTQEGLYRGSFINKAIPYNPYQHISKQFLSLVDALEASCMPRNKAAPIRELPKDTGLTVPFEATELQAYRSKMLADHPALRGRKVVLLYAGGGLLPERAWPAAHYAQVARGLCQAGHAVGLIGLRDDAPLARDLRTQIQSDFCIDLTGYTRSIRELLMLFHGADLLITNDGGPGHFASLTPIRTMVFFGPETGRLYGPLGPRAQVLESGLACSPCLSAYNHRETFCDGDNQCLKRIAPDPVLADALAALAMPTGAAS